MTRGWMQCRIGPFSLETRWEVPAGQVLVLFGPSGAGKTTALRGIAGLVRPQRGHIEVGGRVVFDGEQKVWVPPHRRRIGYLTQQYHLFPHLTVAGNIVYGLPQRRGRGASARAAELMEALDLTGLEKRRPWELSGGQQQRVALARALAPRPELLLLDEPFSALDAELRRTLRGQLRAYLGHAGIPVVLVTHDREEALALGDAVQVIDQGKVVAQGEPLDVLGQPYQNRLARLVGVENLFAMKVEKVHARDGTMVCGGKGLLLEVPLADRDEGDEVTVAVRASDIILAHEEPQRSSARNRLPGVVLGVESRPPGHEVTLDCNGTPLRCRITGSSLEEMGIETGMKLWAVFKASSCFLVRED